ncbi:hypothetical protein Gpo141_00004696 [Globisporangium polare]
MVHVTFVSTATAAAALCLGLAGTADAKPEYVSRIPNGANVPGVQALGHTNPAGGGANNQFGKDFDAAGRKWTTALCSKDSDGDGQTNGQELGDPCCQWTTTNAKLQWTTGVSHPGDKSKTSDATLWASANCSTTSTSADASISDSPAKSSAASSVTAATTTALVLGAVLAFTLY